MGLESASDVVFDYEGCLQFCRDLWSYADDLQTFMTTRETEEGVTLQTFVGDYSAQFVTRVDNERTDVDTAVGQLREGARSWATEWKNAMDEQNRILTAREWESRQDNGGGVVGWAKDRWDDAFGGPEPPPDPDPLGVPQPPSFAATGGFVSF